MGSPRLDLWFCTMGLQLGAHGHPFTQQSKFVLVLILSIFLKSSQGLAYCTLPELNISDTHRSFSIVYLRRNCEYHLCAKVVCHSSMQARIEPAQLLCG